MLNKFLHSEVNLLIQHILIFYLLNLVKAFNQYETCNMNDHHSSSNNPDNLPLLVAIHTKSHHLPFNSCWNLHLLHNVPPQKQNSISHYHLEFCPLSLETPSAKLHPPPPNIPSLEYHKFQHSIPEAADDA